MSGNHYLPLTTEERQEMLATIGAASVDDLFADIPAGIRLQRDMTLPSALSEGEALKHLTALSNKNKSTQSCISFLGAGVYDHFIPAAVGHVTGRSEFYTSYTPYQAEISQGVLQAVFEYQTMICQLTGMHVANASLYDGATALAEGAIMACGATRRKKVVVSRTVHPFYRQVLQTYLDSRGLALEEIPMLNGKTDLTALESLLNNDIAALIVQTPNFFGVLEDMDGVADMLHAKGALLIMSVDPLSLPLLKAPVEYGADIVTGEGQGMGNPSSFGGPLLGFFAATEKLIRRMPGRIVGETVDKEGNRGFVLTLQTREQHIRRERATSNICSNQALNALAAAAYMACLGPAGMREVAHQCLHKADYAKEKITALPGYEMIFSGHHFKEFAVKIPGDAQALNKELLKHNILGGFDVSTYYPELGDVMLFCVTENRTREEIDLLVSVLEGWK
jgi:glycine dehydrogenase subunit 1